MLIFWKNKRTKELFENEENLRKFGLDKKGTRNVLRAIGGIHAADSLDKLPRKYNCHSIKQGRKFLYFAIDIPEIGGSTRGKHRIIFRPPDDAGYTLANLQTIESVEILGIKDYHK